MWMRIKQILAPPVFEGDEEKSRAANLVNTILLTVMFLVTVVSFVVVLVLHNYALMAVVYVSMIMPLSAALWALRRGYVRAASLVITLAIWLVLAVMGFFIGGVVNASFTTMIIVIIIAALVMGARAGVVFAGISTAAVVFVYISEVIGILPPAPGANTTVSYFINHILNYGIAGALLYLAMSNLTTALQRAQRLTVESELQREQLQVLVQERTQDFERSANYLRATTAVARESATAIGDPQALLARVAKIIQEQFSFYHVGLYLLDEAAEWVELRALSGVGQELLDRGFRLRAGVEGIIGDVVRRGEYRLVEDVTQDPLYLQIDETPDMRSELALPLQIRSQIIGVLDVQSTEAGAFAEQDVLILQALADQVAIAISNARLVEQVQRAAEVERRIYTAQTGEAWQNLLRTGQMLGFYSTGQTTAPAGDLWQPEMKAALQTGATVQDSLNARRLAVPVKVREEVVGVIDFAKPGEGGVWTAEEIALVESLTEQLGIALESARLYQDTQSAAARERMLGQVTGRMRETLDMETVLKTATRELRQALGLEGVLVQLARPKKSREVDDGAA